MSSVKLHQLPFLQCGVQNRTRQPYGPISWRFTYRRRQGAQRHLTGAAVMLQWRRRRWWFLRNKQWSFSTNRTWMMFTSQPSHQDVGGWGSGGGILTQEVNRPPDGEKETRKLIWINRRRTILEEMHKHLCRIKSATRQQRRIHTATPLLCVCVCTIECDKSCFIWFIFT